MATKVDIKFCINIIKEVERHPCLYDLQHKDYNNKRLTESVWKEIGVKFKDHGSVCRSKWRSIRASYIRWKNLKCQSGSKEYYLGPYLKFLDPHTRTRSIIIKTIYSPLRVEEESIEFAEVTDQQLQTTNLSSDEEIDYLEEWTNERLETEEPSQSQPVKKEIKRRKSATDLLVENDTSVEEFSTVKNKMETESRSSLKNNDPNELYLMSLLPHLRTMSERQLLAFHGGVADLIEKIKYPEETS